MESFEIFSKLSEHSDAQWQKVGETDVNVQVFTHEGLTTDSTL